MALLKFKKQTGYYKGKVRDVYYIGEEWLVMIASNRISAFDVILPAPIPFKGQVLNQLAAFMMEKTADICPNWLVEIPAPQVAIGKLCQPFKVEMVVRGNLTGHAWRTYNSGLRTLSGVSLPEGMKENDFFSSPIITPTTKAGVGHDENISREQIIQQGFVNEQDYTQIEKYTLALFERGKEIASKQDLILVDTKYEFGKIKDTIYLMDEIHTPDSSRYFYADGFTERQVNGERQKQLSKEFVREWLISKDFMGKEGQTVPAMDDDWVQTISRRYIELYEKVIGIPFEPETLSEEEIYQRIESSLNRLVLCQL
ncbi:MAG: phosphoribosylaminoimidazolesuccinocarboxamide synthase [Chitinophagaceae bacterium]